MEAVSSARAARRLGLSTQKFHRLTSEHGIEPVFTGEGITGAKFWSTTDIDQLAAEMRQELADKIARLDAARNVS